MSNIVGIDLGTTFSSLAMLNAIGKPEIVPNADGDRLTPSAIFFDEDNPGVIRVGIEALNSRHINPARSVRWVKRHMGDPDYKVSIDGKDWTATELSALILKKLRQDSAAQIGEIRDAVISVPAHFDEIRRKATMDAGTAAGFNVIGIVNEPVAAALCYATSREVSGRVLVYDLGGGTFDVTLMNVKGLEMEIICSQGDHALGGIDFDKKVLEILQKMYKDKFGGELIDSEEDRAKYEDEAEDIKKTLSRRPTAKTMLYGPSGSMRVEVSRQMFEETIASLVSRADMLVEVALDEVGLKPSDIDTVLLVGGSTRVPLVRTHLEQIFGFPPECSVNVDECVALGAALHAGLAMMRQNPEAVAAGDSHGDSGHQPDRRVQPQLRHDLCPDRQGDRPAGRAEPDHPEEEHPPALRGHADVLHGLRGPETHRGHDHAGRGQPIRRMSTRSPRTASSCRPTGRPSGRSR